MVLYTAMNVDDDEPLTGRNEKSLVKLLRDYYPLGKNFLFKVFCPLSVRLNRIKVFTRPAMFSTLSRRRHTKMTASCAASDICNFNEFATFTTIFSLFRPTHHRPSPNCVVNTFCL